MIKKEDRLSLTLDYLSERSTSVQDHGFPEPKWIIFSRVLLQLGFEINLHEAQETKSKYLRISMSGRNEIYKVRFSNHPPIHYNNKNTFFVGVSRHGITTYKDAIRATLLFFGMDVKQTREKYIKLLQS